MGVPVEQLYLPVKSFLDERLETSPEMKAIDGKLQRQFRAIQHFLESPHMTFGQFAVSPMFYDEDLVSHAVSMPSDATSNYTTYNFPHTPVSVDRAFRIFIWSISEIENTSVTDYAVKANLTCHPSWHDQNRKLSQRFFSANAKRYQMFVCRSFSGNPPGPGETLTLKWEYQQTDASSRDAEIKRQFAIWAMYYAPDAEYDEQDGAGSTSSVNPIRWTRQTDLQDAYRFTG